MKNFFTTLLCLSITIATTFGQDNTPEERKGVVTVGFLKGGGALIGVDYERLVSKNVGLQVGIGFAAFGAGINYHFKPSVRSSFVSLQYWNQGFTGKNFVQNILSANYVYRAKKWLVAQIGLGAPLSRGPAFSTEVQKTPVVLTYAVGVYLPID